MTLSVRWPSHPYRSLAVGVVDNGDMRLGFLPSVGGRLLSLRSGGVEFLWRNPRFFDEDLLPLEPRSSWRPLDGTQASWANIGGSKTWPAPQGWGGEGQWPGPPDPVIDSGDWSLSEEWDDDRGELTVTMVSPTDAATGLQVTRRFFVPAAGRRFRQRSTFRNISNTDVEWSVWEVCQVDTAPDGGPQASGTVAVTVEDDDPHVDLCVSVGRVEVGAPRDGARSVQVRPVVGKVGFPSASGVLRYGRGDGAAITLNFQPQHGGRYPDGGSRAELWMQSPQDAPLHELGGASAGRSPHRAGGPLAAGEAGSRCRSAPRPVLERHAAHSRMPGARAMKHGDATVVPESGTPRLRIAIGGIGTESSTFSPREMALGDFRILRGDGLLAFYPFVTEQCFAGVEWVPLVRAWGQPDGPVSPAAADALDDELIRGLEEAGPLDGVLLDLHGAMAVQGRDRYEERLLGRVRGAVGPHPLISLSLDPHGNMSRELAEHADLMTAFRLAPHTDQAETRERAARTLVECARTRRRPAKAWVRIPVLLNGERTGTDAEPGASVFARAGELANRDGIVDTGLWVGFGWADEERCSASAVATGWDEAAVLAAAEELAQTYWHAREEFQFIAPRTGNVAEAVEAILAASAAPLLVSDAGDNVTAGGVGDLPVMLRALLDERVRASGRSILLAGMADPEAVAACAAAGAGADIRLEVGGSADPRHGPPVPIDVTVERVFPRSDGLTVAVARAAKITLLLSDRRTRWVEQNHFAEAGVPLGGFDAVVVKNGYLFPYQRSVAADWFMALTPGATDLSHNRLRFTNLRRPMFPFERRFDADLSPVLLHRLEENV
jgi:microcystin degradation protein MlrC